MFQDTIDVAISKQNGSSPFIGAVKQIGFVPKYGFFAFGTFTNASAFVKENAERYNVKGFVRNLEDGRVEVFLEGNSDDVNKMIDLCKKGPKHSQIRNVQIKPEKFQDFKVFKVLHI